MIIAVLVIAMPLLGWSAVALVANYRDSSSQQDDVPGIASSSTSAGAQSTTPDSYRVAHAARTALRECGARLTAGQAVVTEADTGAGHWSEHIEARTDLLAGRNTSEQAKAIWKRTRLAGPGDLDRFAATLTTYNALPGCDDIDPEQAPPNLQADAEACLRRATSTEAAVIAAIAVIDDWEAHLNAMAAHADGEMDADEAQKKWVEAWESAPTNINGFRKARDELERTPECQEPS